VQWRVSAPSGAPGVTPGDPDWSVVYAYDRWLPLFYTGASLDTSFLVGASAVDGELATLREETLEAGIQLPIRRVRHSQRWLLAGTRSTNTLDRRVTEDVFRRVSLRTGWAYRSARVYGYSISPEDGVAGGMTVEYARGRLTEVDSATTVTADLRAYAPGLDRQHVLAVRLAGGSSTGPRALGRLFRLGGGNPNADTLNFGRSAFSLLRGFASDQFAGQRVAVMNVDYRLPLARVERGRGTWPFFVRQVHGSVFVDAGHAWSDRFRMRDVKTSVGAELATDVVIGFALPFTFAAGVARGHDGTGRVPDTTTTFVRIGRAF
jgi:outer membrane protein assembly factor BamA